MGNRFTLETENNCKEFYKNESKILREVPPFWEPKIKIKLVNNNQIIIEPMDQRRNSRYHLYLKELLGRVYKKFDYFSFKKEEGFYPNPQLHPLFFKYVILKDALDRAKNKKEHLSIPDSDRLEAMDKNPLSDYLLEEMLNNGLYIRYSETLEAGTGCCWPEIEGLMKIVVSKQGTQKDVDETLVHEIVEAYVKKIYSSSRFIPHDYIDMLMEELYEFGFSQTIKRLDSIVK